jgi:7,8-dihydropterin-6-yl-methyl-4-(beta-D-ribofuranosyl)aminobenzene 5'-phosphate synthase
MNEIGSLKITTLADNFVLAGGVGQWGLSFLMDLEDARGDQRKVVFDTSANKDALMHNAKLLEVDFTDVDCIIISHGHGDHTAANVEIVEASGGVKVYGHPHTFLPRFYEDKKGKRTRGGPPKGEGIEEIEVAGGEVILSSKPEEVVPGLWTTGQMERNSDFEVVSARSPGGGKRIIVVDGEEKQDLILDDQALWTIVKGVGPWVVTGCAHSGPLNTIRQVKRLGAFDRIEGFVGGTHLVGRSDEYLNRTIMEFADFGLNLISPCHCTGFKATAEFWRAFPKEFVVNCCLRVIKAGKIPEDRLI